MTEKPKSWRDVVRRERERKMEAAQNHLIQSEGATRSTPLLGAKNSRNSSQEVGSPALGAEGVEVEAEGGVEVEVGEGLQTFVFAPQMPPIRHQLTLRVGQRVAWNLVIDLLEQLQQGRTGPIEFTFVGLLQNTTEAWEGDWDNADDPSWGAP